MYLPAKACVVRIVLEDVIPAAKIYQSFISIDIEALKFTNS